LLWRLVGGGWKVFRRKRQGGEGFFREKPWCVTPWFVEAFGFYKR